MSWMHDALGVPEDASEKDIKRAYAKQLKLTRPQDDPEGFQRLNEVYQAALSWSAGRDAGEPPAHEPEVSETMDGPVAVMEMDSPEAASVDGPANQPAAPLAPAPAAAESPPSAHALALECVGQARRLESDAELTAWLQTQPDLWNLSLKNEVALWLPGMLAGHGLALSHARQAVLIGFFQLDEVQAGADAQLFQLTCLRLDLGWQLNQTHWEDQHQRWIDEGNQGVDYPTWRRLMTHLTKPFSTARSLGFALWPGRAQKMRAVLMWLTRDGEVTVPGRIEAPRTAFWDRAGDSERLSVPRTAVGVARWVLVYAALWLVLGAELYASDGADATEKIRTLHAVVGVGIVGWLLWVFGLHFARWLSTPQALVEPRLLWWHVSVVPLVAVGSYLTKVVFDLNDLGKGLHILTAMVLAMRLVGHNRERLGMSETSSGRLQVWLCLVLLVNLPRVLLDNFQDRHLLALVFLLGFAALDAALRWPLWERRAAAR